jgi:hypothetical protein
MEEFMIKGKAVDPSDLVGNQRKLELDFLNAVIPKTPDGKIIVMVDEGECEVLSPIERLQKFALDKFLVTEKKPYNKVIKLQK